MSGFFLKRPFLPYFLTQSLGAFNDNVYKNVLLILVAFAPAQSLKIQSDLYINLAAGVFILPFFVFSAFAGELCDKYEKSALIRKIKLAEILIMILASLAFYYQAYFVLLILLFLMGTQSAFFGPVKYSLLPQIVEKNQLLSANAWVEAGTFLSILGGTILAGFIAGMQQATIIAGITVVILSLLGFISARLIPSIKANNPNLKIRYSWFKQIKTTFYIAKQERSVWLSILAISWFWFLGASYLTQFPNYTKIFLGGSQEIVSLLLVLFSVGIAIGSFICAQLPKFNHSKIGIVIISLFGGLLVFFTPEQVFVYKDLFDFILHPSLFGVFLSLLFIGIGGGLFVVPRFTHIQQASKEEIRSQVIAGSNICDAFFMVSSAIVGIIMLVVLKITIVDYFLCLSLVNSIIAVIILRQSAFAATTN